jgi:hypothetical protein
MSLARLMLVVAALSLAPGAVRAQFQPGLPGGPPGPPGPTTRPAFSPYLNLARRDTAPGINYYGLVRPQINTQQSIQGLQQQQQATARELVMQQGAVSPDLPVTGQPVGFMNAGGYFMNQRAVPTVYNRPTTLPARPAAPAAPVRTR